MSKEELFWSYVDKGSAEECWPWVGAKNNGGYGAFYLYRGRHVSSHRQAYVYTNGGIPRGRSILHSCDNPPCCNPNHLYAGTAKDNMRDAISRGRWTPRATVRTAVELEHRAEATRRLRNATPTSRAVDGFTSDLETLLIALSQRAFTDEQLERLARILQTAERDLLSRLADRSTTSAARTRGKRVRAA